MKRARRLLPRASGLVGWLTVVSALPGLAVAGPITFGSAELVAYGENPRFDGLAFDRHGNLFVAHETFPGGISYVDTSAGPRQIHVPNLTTVPIPIADQIAFNMNGELFITSEVPGLVPPGDPPGTVPNLYRATIQYDASNVPIAAIVDPLSTNVPLQRPEGLVVLQEDGDFGRAGDLLVGEDDVGGGIFLVAVDTGTTTPLVSETFNRPEGFAFGDFNGQQAPALYFAETGTGTIWRVKVGPGGLETEEFATGLQMPDNVTFGPDGYLYVSQDLKNGSIARIDPATGEVVTVLEGFDSPQGMLFDTDNGYFYLSERVAGKIWRFSTTSAVPEPSTALLLALGVVLLPIIRRRLSSR